jgi:3-oxoacyl-[acyl-carrier protein] reductase
MHHCNRKSKGESKMKLKNKVAVVTGAARGIGFATAKRFCEEGAAVALWDMDTELLKEAAEKLQETARNLSGDVKICCICVNVSEKESVQDAFAQTEKELGSVDILVNNAGITRDAMLHKMSDEQWEAVINVNLKGVFLCGREAATRMREKGNGVILNTSSVVGLYGNIGQSNYAATKAGVIAMTNTWAKELGPKGIRVNAVAPGYTMTEMMQTVPEKVLNSICDKTPLRRLATREEIAAAFAYLASDEAAFITGHVLSVDGGLVL